MYHVRGVEIRIWGGRNTFSRISASSFYNFLEYFDKDISTYSASGNEIQAGRAGWFGSGIIEYG
jgi:hypothetical protein